MSIFKYNKSIDYLLREGVVMDFRFARALYAKEALLKAAYCFTDCYYLHLDADEAFYYVSMEPKDGTSRISEKEFQNAVLAETVRLCVAQKTKNVRELILARAFSSTIIEKNEAEAPDEERFDIDSILTDWFESNDSNKTE